MSDTHTWASMDFIVALIGLAAAFALYLQWLERRRQRLREKQQREINRLRVPRVAPDKLERRVLSLNQQATEQWLASQDISRNDPQVSSKLLQILDGQWTYEQQREYADRGDENE